MSEDFLDPEPVEGPASVSSTTPYGTVTLSNIRGQVWIHWSVNLPVKVEAWVALYEGDPPAFPTLDKAWGGKPINGRSGSYNTGKPWGPGWSGSLYGRGWKEGFAYITVTENT